MQNFKGDALELKMQDCANPAFDSVGSSLDDFYSNGETSAAFYLMLYDEGRMPFSDRIARNVFVDFITKALVNFLFMGTFESFIFILKGIFGEEALILFDVPAPGKLSIAVSSSSEIPFEAIGREVNEGVYSYFNLTTDSGELLVFRGISGIESQYELELLFAEILPAGIFLDISLEFFTLIGFIGEDDSGIFSMIDDAGNDIVFIETTE